MMVSDNKKELFRPNEVYKIAGITRKTLEIYEKKGLVKPAMEDLKQIRKEKTGTEEQIYRYYDERTLYNLLFIQMLKDMGFSLGEIVSIFHEITDENGLGYDSILARLREKKRSLNKNIAYLEYIKEYESINPEVLKRYETRIPVQYDETKKSFTDLYGLLDSVVTENSTEEEISQFAKSAALGVEIGSIAYYSKEKKPDDNEIQGEIDKAVDRMMALFPSIIEKDDDVKFSEKELWCSMALEFIRKIKGEPTKTEDFITDEEMEQFELPITQVKSDVVKTFGHGADRFLLKAVCCYLENHSSEDVFEDW